MNKILMLMVFALCLGCRAEHSVKTYDPTTLSNEALQIQVRMSEARRQAAVDALEASERLRAQQQLLDAQQAHQDRWDDR